MTDEPAAGERVVVRRVIGAPRERVFRSWTDPEQLRRWWGPGAFTCPDAQVDLRTGGTYRLVDKVMKRWGLEYELVDQTDLGEVERAVRDDTRLIWVETPTNPLLNVVDVEGVLARRRSALVAVDSTFATPFYQRPLELEERPARPLSDRLLRRVLAIVLPDPKLF